MHFENGMKGWKGLIPSQSRQGWWRCSSEESGLWRDGVIPPFPPLLSVMCLILLGYGWGDFKELFRDQGSSSLVSTTENF